MIDAAPTRKVILLVQCSHAAGRALLGGIARYAHDQGPWVFYWEPGGLERSWPRLRKLPADGIIVHDMEHVEKVLAHGLPVVLAGHLYSELVGGGHIVADSDAIGALAAEHLLSCGLKNFGFCGFEKTPWSVARGEAFARRIGKARFKVRARYVRSWTTDGAWRKERGGIAKWLRSLPKPMGLLASNDTLGQEVIEACKAAGLRVPDEVAVVGVDNDEVVCGLCNPPMSSVAINFERAGYEAARVLDELMRGRKPVSSQVVVRATHLVPRRSTDMLAVEDAALAKALRFIRDYAKTGVAVSETARVAGVSQRVLEKRFRRVLNRSVREEIQRVRSNEIARLLIETTLPIGQIAELLEFEDVRHIARYFRAGKGLSPLAYRKAYGSKGTAP